MLKKCGIIIALSCMICQTALFAQEPGAKVFKHLNEFRKLKGAKPLELDSLSQAGLQKLQTKFKRQYLQKNATITAASTQPSNKKKLSDEVLFRLSILNTVMDADVKVFRIKATTIDEALSPASLEQIPELKSAFADKDYNELGYSVLQENGDTLIVVGLTKRYIDFFPRVQCGTNGEVSTYTKRGVSRIDELFYDVVDVPEGSVFTKIKPVNKKKVVLNKDRSFSVSATVQEPHIEPNKWKLLGFFNKQNELVAFLPLGNIFISLDDDYLD
jgi:hypothetical protein